MPPTGRGVTIDWKTSSRTEITITAPTTSSSVFLATSPHGAMSSGPSRSHGAAGCGASDELHQAHIFGKGGFPGWVGQPFQRRWRRKSPPKVVALSAPTFSPRQKGLASRPTPREAVHKRGSRTIMKALRLVLVAAAAALAGLFLAVPAGATDT